MSILMKPIGTVRSTRRELADDDWEKETVTIELAQEFSEDSLAGLTDFSHVEVLFHMDQVDAERVELGARHPRGNVSWPKVGIFAQRGKDRPNQIGLTVCRILKVEGRVLSVEGLDAVHGTPVLDLKPWVKEFAPRGPVFQPGWMEELMKAYWKK